MSIELITEYHPNGQKKYKGHYNGVHPVGDHTAWYECGDKEYESIELDESTEIVTYWYENGQIKSKGNCTDYWKSGSWTEWNENGNKRSEGFYKGKDERDWDQFHNPKNLAMALSVEASELVEIFQWLTPEQAEAIMDSRESEHVKEEIADIMIYLIRITDKLDVDLEKAITNKIIKNGKKHPSKGWLKQ